jgi:TPR repeat protein
MCVQGDTQAAANLAHMYVHGLGVPVDYDKALELLEPGMSNREAAAYTLKAYMYAG